jgi:hypothetical protein
LIDAIQNSMHVKEVKHRRIRVASDGERISNEMEKYPHPLDDHRPHLHNPSTGQITSVNKQFFVLGELPIFGQKFRRKIKEKFWCSKIGIV